MQTQNRPKSPEPSRTIRNRWIRRLPHGAASLQSELAPIGSTDFDDLNASDCWVEASAGSGLIRTALHIRQSLWVHTPRIFVGYKYRNWTKLIKTSQVSDVRNAQYTTIRPLDTCM